MWPIGIKKSAIFILLLGYSREWIKSVGCNKMLKKMMAAGICPPPSQSHTKTQTPFDMDARRTLIEPEFPQNVGKWNRNAPTSPSCKGVYAYVSSPKTIYTTRKLTNSITTSQYVYSISVYIFYFCLFWFSFIVVVYCYRLIWCICVTFIGKVCDSIFSNDKNIETSISTL